MGEAHSETEMRNNAEYIAQLTSEMQTHLSQSEDRNSEMGQARAALERTHGEVAPYRDPCQEAAATEFQRLCVREGALFVEI